MHEPVFKSDDLLHVTICHPSERRIHGYLVIANDGVLTFGTYRDGKEEQNRTRMQRLSSERVATLIDKLRFLGESRQAIALSAFGPESVGFPVSVVLRFWQDGVEAEAKPLLPHLGGNSIDPWDRIGYERAFDAILVELPLHLIGLKSSKSTALLIQTQGTAVLRSGRVLKADYQPNENGVGTLLLTLDNEVAVYAREIRIDPCIGGEFHLIEFAGGNCFLICGAQAVVVIDATSLAWRSSIGLEYQEMVSWHVEVEETRRLIVATWQRVWCVDDGGVIRWLWSCKNSEQYRWISREPVIEADQVCITLATAAEERITMLWASSGLSADVSDKLMAG